MLSILANIFVGELRGLGETLVCSPLPPQRAVPVSRLIQDRATLQKLLLGHACSLHMQNGDMRPVASDWSLRYLWALLPPLVAATSLMRHRLPTAAGEMAVEFDNDGEPLRFHIPHEGNPAPESEAFSRYQPLLMQHLAPLFSAISELTRLPEKVLWGNAARYLDILLDQALLMSDGAPPLIADKTALLQTPSMSSGARNPLYAKRQRATRLHEGEPVLLTLHQQCCLAHLLPDQEYCGACPLLPQSHALTATAPTF